MTEYQGHERAIVIGPKAHGVLSDFLKANEYRSAAIAMFCLYPGRRRNEISLPC